MKRLFLLIPIFILLTRLPAPAQDTSGGAAAIAARQDADERYKRMASDLQTVQQDNEALHAKITALEQEIQSLRDAQAHPADNGNVQDALKHLAEKIEEVDKKRLEDKEAISEDIHKSIEDIKRALGSTGTGIHETPPTKIIPTTGKGPDSTVTDGYTYTIRDGDRLEAILKAYNAEFKAKGLKTITIKQAEEANPGVDWGRLRVKQKIIIPRPPGG